MLAIDGTVRARACRLLGSVEEEHELWQQHGAAPERYLYHLTHRPMVTGAATVHKTCRKCGGAVTILSVEQRRSADEGATVYLGCKQCKHKWRVNT